MALLDSCFKGLGDHIPERMVVRLPYSMSRGMVYSHFVGQTYAADRPAVSRSQFYTVLVQRIQECDYPKVHVLT